ncbi:MAG: cupin domain-containing protein [Pseudomonadota bacterium]
MAETASSSARLNGVLAERVVHYADLKPCTTAFIDTRTPGSKQKENFTIIGPGVAESPDQHVHINIPHGFNIGGARQPPGCINSQHSHETAEVFVVHSGTWAFHMGPNKEDGDVILSPGDTISIPVHTFRGFTNVGDDTGFLFAVLGGDDPGHVTWAPYVFDNAREYGLVLLEDGSLVDTTRGETVPDGKRAMKPTTDVDVENLDTLRAEDMGGCVVTRGELDAAPSALVTGLSEFPIIGSACSAEGVDAGKMDWPHGFHVRYATLDVGGETPRHTRHEEEVLMLQSGALRVTVDEGDINLGPGDVFTIPIGAPRTFRNFGDSAVEAYVVRGGDHPKPPSLQN